MESGHAIASNWNFSSDDDTGTFQNDNLLQHDVKPTDMGVYSHPTIDQHPPHDDTDREENVLSHHPP